MQPGKFSKPNTKKRYFITNKSSDYWFFEFNDELEKLKDNLKRRVEESKTKNIDLGYYRDRYIDFRRAKNEAIIFNIRVSIKEKNGYTIDNYILFTLESGYDGVMFNVHVRRCERNYKYKYLDKFIDKILDIYEDELEKIANKILEI